MSLSKHQLSAVLKRKCVSFDEKIVILDYANLHPKMGCRKIAEHFSDGKTAVLNILKDCKNYSELHVTGAIIFSLLIITLLFINGLQKYLQEGFSKVT